MSNKYRCYCCGYNFANRDSLRVHHKNPRFDCGEMKRRMAEVFCDQDDHSVQKKQKDNSSASSASSASASASAASDSAPITINVLDRYVDEVKLDSLVQHTQCLQSAALPKESIVLALGFDPLLKNSITRGQTVQMLQVIEHHVNIILKMFQ